MPLQSGTTLGPYEILSPIGAGGMGEVYKARDTRLDRTVAIKVLPEHVASDPDLKQRFEREAIQSGIANQPGPELAHRVARRRAYSVEVFEDVTARRGTHPFCRRPPARSRTTLAVRRCTGSPVSR